MSASMNDIVDQMRAALAVSDPDLDTSVGTTTRKILDAVGESIAETYLDQHMVSYVYDIDSKTDADLDTFCQTVGGISRLAAKRATGTVTFSRGGTTTSLVLIPINTQVGTSSDTDSESFVTVTGGTLMPGQTSVTVPVQAVNAGPGGNVGANTITVQTSLLDGVSTVSNIQPMSGGTDQESDDQLRARWKQTVFRSMAGTSSMYLGQALDHPNVTAATVLGSSVNRFEQVQATIATSGTYNGKLIAQSTATDVAYTFPTGVVLGGDIGAGAVMVEGVDYTWVTTVNPPLAVFQSTGMTYDTGSTDVNGKPVLQTLNGAVLDLQFQYTPTQSRNDPDGSRFGGVATMSKVDVLVSGQNPTSASQSVSFLGTQIFTASTTSPLYTGNFVRQDGSNPTANNVFLPLAFGPIIAVPDLLNIGGSTYGRVGAPTTGLNFPNAYQVVHDQTAFGYTANSRFGLEFVAGSIPANGADFTIGDNGSYLYDSVPGDVQVAIDRWRLVGIDAQVHGALLTSLRFSLAVMYERNSSRTVVDASIDTAISALLTQVGLGGVLQVSDVVFAVHGVPGVDNVRMLAPSDYPTWTYATTNTFPIGIQQIVNATVAKTWVSSSGHLQDVVLRDNQAPVFESASKVAKAQNTFQAS